MKTQGGAVFAISVLLYPWVFPRGAAALVSSWWGFFPLFLLFCGFAAGSLSWGLLAARRWGGGLAAIFLYASLFLLLGAGILGHLGLLQTAAPILMPLSLAIGIYLAREEWRARWVNRSWPPGPRARFFFFLLGLAACIRFFSAFIPQSHGDPLLYHLMGPRLWVQAGRIGFNAELPSAFLASAWEYLYVWPQVIWRGSALQGLIAAQLFSQWIHLWLGWIGGGIVLYSFARSLSFRLETAAFMAFASLFTGSLQWTSGLAKNDAGVSFWALGSLYLLWQATAGNLPAVAYFVGGLLAGLAMAGKISAGLLLAPAASLLLWRGSCLPRGKMKALALTGAGAFAGLLPFWARGYAALGNPFFPLFFERFPSPYLSQSWKDLFLSLQPLSGGASIALVLRRLRELTRESPFVAGWVFIPFLFSFRPGLRKALRPPLLLTLASFSLFCAGFGANAELRYLGGVLPLFVALGAAAAWEIRPQKWQRAGASMLVVAVLASSHLPFHILPKLNRIAVGRAALLEHTAGDAKAWIREHVAPDALVVVMGDNELYYLSSQRTTVLTERADIDRATYGQTDPQKFFRGLCESSHARFLLDARPAIGLKKNYPQLAEKIPILFAGANSAVYDLAAGERAFGTRYGCLPGPY